MATNRNGMVYSYILIQVMANALSVTRTCVRARWSGYVTSVITDPTRAVVQFVAGQECPTLITAKSVPSKRKM